MTLCRPLLVGIVAAIVAGCGPTPPQAPFRQAQKLDVSTGGISTACGESYQILQFTPGDRRDFGTLEATALDEARKLASVYALNPGWIYQGETVRQILADSESLLGSCGLRAAQAQLKQATARR